MEQVEFKTARRKALKLISTAVVGLLALLSARFTWFLERRKRRLKIPLTQIQQAVHLETEVIVVNKGGQWRVFLRSCPHLGCKVRLDEKQQRFVCPCHGSQFTLDGRFIKGPAGRNLKTAPFEQVEQTLIVKL